MSKSRSVSRSTSSGTISVDASYAQELVEFWTQKYEQIREELDQIRVRVLRRNFENCWCVPLTDGIVITRMPPLLLHRHPEVALPTGMRRGGADPVPPRSSESRIIGFPTPNAIQYPAHVQ